jgi:competence protein ComEC
MGGGSNNPEKRSSVGENIVVPFLLDNGITSLDMVVATHGHDDHVQGLTDVLENLKVKKLLLPDINNNEGLESLIELAEKKKIHIVRCADRDLIHLDKNTLLYVLNPPLNSAGDDASINKASLNNTSLVLKLQYKDLKVLFTADAEKEVEERLLREDKDLFADVLKVGHHGSETSTSQAFLESVNPNAAVISVGKNNFGHPSEEVMCRLEEADIKIFRTDLDGAITIRKGLGKTRLFKQIS